MSARVQVKYCASSVIKEVFHEGLMEPTEVEVLNKLYDLGLDVQPLIEQAVEIEQSMGKLAEEVQQQAEQTPKKDLPMYG